MFFGVSCGFVVEQLFDLSLHACSAPRQQTAATSSTASIFARFAATAGTIGSRHTGSSNPISAIAAFTGIGFDFDEIHFHQRQPLPLQLARAGEIARQSAAASSLVISRGNLVRDHGNHAAAAQRDQRNGDRIVAAQARRSSRHLRAPPAPSG